MKKEHCHQNHQTNASTMTPQKCHRNVGIGETNEAKNNQTTSPYCTTVCLTLHRKAAKTTTKIPPLLGPTFGSRSHLRLTENCTTTSGFVRRMAEQTAQEEKRTIDTTRGKMTKINENTRKNQDRPRGGGARGGPERGG